MEFTLLFINLFFWKQTVHVYKQNFLQRSILITGFCELSEEWVDSFYHAGLAHAMD